MGTTGELFEEIKEMVESEDLTLKQGVRLLMRGWIAQYEREKQRDIWQKKTDARLDALESKDKRFVALVGLAAAVIGSIVTLVGNAIIG